MRPTWAVHLPCAAPSVVVQKALRHEGRLHGDYGLLDIQPIGRPGMVWLEVVGKDIVSLPPRHGDYGPGLGVSPATVRAWCACGALLAPLVVVEWDGARQIALDAQARAAREHPDDPLDNASKEIQ